MLNDADFKRTFLPSVKPGAKPEAAIKAFVEKNKSNALKRKPKVDDANTVRVLVHTANGYISRTILSNIGTSSS